jgi:HPt (histidine-containing phosphotransfer) domain-containing protein
MIEIFYEDVPRIMELLDAGLAQCDCGMVERAGHSLRGMISYYGVAEPIETARQIELAGRQRDLDAVPSLARRLHQQVESLKQVLQPYR